MKKAEYKVPGGKLVAVEIEATDDTFINVKITGDFFMHPEAAIQDLEQALCNTSINKLNDNIQRFFYINNVTLFGVSSEDFVHTIKLALES